MEGLPGQPSASQGACTGAPQVTCSGFFKGPVPARVVPQRRPLCVPQAGAPSPLLSLLWGLSLRQQDHRVVADLGSGACPSGLTAVPETFLNHFY